MKRCLSLSLLIFFFCIAPIFQASGENLQIVMPHIIYIGDTVEIRYMFHSDAKLFDDDFDKNQAASISLNQEYDFFRAQEESFTVKAASLEKINSDYTLSLSVIPWKTGLCQIPPFNLVSLVAQSRNKASVNSQAFIISLSPFEVKSLVQKTGTRSFLPQAHPLILPGTTAILVVAAILALTAFSALLFALLHLPRVVRALEQFTYIYSLKKNSRKAIKRLRSIQKKSESVSSDKEFSALIQLAIRDFLNGRFGYNFSAVTSSALYPAFLDLCGGSLTPHQENAVEHLLSLFNRIDFVRFSENAVLLKADENNNQDERDSLCEKAIILIEEFDSNDDSEKEES